MPVLWKGCRIVGWTVGLEIPVIDEPCQPRNSPSLPGPSRVRTPRYNGVRCVHNAFRHGAHPPPPPDMINRALCYLLRTTTVRETEENEGVERIPKGWNRNLLAPTTPAHNYFQLSLIFVFLIFFFLFLLDFPNEAKEKSRLLLFLMFTFISGRREKKERDESLLRV